MASPTIPTHMRAWHATSNGPPRPALALSTTTPVPSAPRAHNLVIKLAHAALNPADINFMADIPVWLPFRRHPIVGLDFSGTVVAVGSAVTPTAHADLQVGAQVAGALNVMSVLQGRGSMAEYVEVPASKVTPLPSLNGGTEKLGLRDAAGALGVAGQTAAKVMDEAKLQKGDTVLVNGASGGVGSVLVQVAKASGATVYGVCSAANAEMVKRLGADEVIDYTAHASLTSHLAERFSASSSTSTSPPLNFIFDCAGSDELFRNSNAYLASNGAYLTIVGNVGRGTIMRSKYLPVALGGTPRTFAMIMLMPGGVWAKKAAKWIEDGHYHEFPIDSEWPFDQVVEAYERLASKRAKGKIIIKMT